jgi:hypothetical protein
MLLTSSSSLLPSTALAHAAVDVGRTANTKVHQYGNTYKMVIHTQKKT